ncbi:probable glutamate--tRNA ligase, mitochondrial [Schistocerca piceifrons]|uniref:probable glutamate--tRNA ligase, mitochondrial n=1 Tax=Schistocerca piceifrons TaxID=274613 RepID=UPI001F5EBA4D|nr:probable glutamate--tRNA ligase, mitochondrial [Schistocerca piceifrons]
MCWLSNMFTKGTKCCVFIEFASRNISTAPLRRSKGKVLEGRHEVRVRFAPSPTGHLHLGGLRTALYNYLFAKSHNGQFVLRIEDTDQSRLVPEAAEKLEKDLNWAGIEPDESPLQGGPYGPYKQSERLNLYRKHAEYLLSSGKAYPCFCTERRLELLRKEALKARQVPRYDNKCRHLSNSEVGERLEQGTPHCIRFKLSPTDPFLDLIYGEISYDLTKSEGDPVIMKADGYPTYHFANVVDDHFMEISHVLRGVEWQISTSKHILLYKAFGWRPPLYGHLPLIMNKDGTKLSKRQGDITVEYFQKANVFPLALINYITSAGGGFERNMDKVKPQIYLMQDLINQFSTTRINPNSCRLVPERLEEFNKLELQRKLRNEDETKVLIEKVKDIISDTFKDRLENTVLQLDDSHIKAVLLWSQNRIHSITDLTGSDMAFLWTLPSSSSLQSSTTEVLSQGILQELIAYLSKEQLKDDFQKNNLKALLRKFASEKRISFSNFMRVLRHILSGLKEGPGVAEMMEMLGPERTVSRLQHALPLLKQE